MMKKALGGGECLSRIFILTAIPHYTLQLLIAEINCFSEGEMETHVQVRGAFLGLSFKDLVASVGF